MKVFTPTSIAGLLQTFNDRSKRLWLMCSLFAMICLGGMNLQAQTTVQNFGTGTATQTSQTGSTAIIPNPTAGTTWARGGAVAPAAPVNILNTSNPLGTTGSYMRATASSSTSVCKASPFINYGGSTEFYTSFKIFRL